MASDGIPPGRCSAVAALALAASLFSAGCSKPLSIRVSGNHFVNGAGHTIRLLGVNREGPNYMCTGGVAPGSDNRPPAVFDGPSDDASIAAMAAWRINAVRLPLNESCWLGINGVDPTAGGDAYRRAIQDYVNRLHSHGLYVILELYANAPGARLAVTQQNGPDADHAPAFWASVASTFRNDPAVVFDLYNEPILAPDTTIGSYTSATPSLTAPWDCWQTGGCFATRYDTAQPVVPQVIGPDGNPVTQLDATSWEMSSMQDLLDTVRRTGAKQPVLLGGTRWALDVSEWLTHLPVDPENQLAASVHLYDFSGTGYLSDAAFYAWTQDPATVAQSHPVVTGELGEIGVNDPHYWFMGRYMDWADTQGVSYLLYTWVRWHENGQEVDGGITVIASYDGTPSPMGQSFHDRMVQTGGQ